MSFAPDDVMGLLAATDVDFLAENPQGFRFLAIHRTSEDVRRTLVRGAESPITVAGFRDLLVSPTDRLCAIGRDFCHPGEMADPLYLWQSESDQLVEIQGTCWLEVPGTQAVARIELFTSSGAVFVKTVEYGELLSVSWPMKIAKDEEVGIRVSGVGSIEDARLSMRWLIKSIIDEGKVPQVHAQSLVANDGTGEAVCVSLLPGNLQLKILLCEPLTIPESVLVFNRCIREPLSRVLPDRPLGTNGYFRLSEERSHG